MKSENSRGEMYYWVVKLDASGNIEWQRTLGGASDDGYGGDLFSDVIQANDGGLLLGGFSNTGISGDKTEGSRGSFDYWVLKLDAVGEIQWQKTIGGNSRDFLYSICPTIDGNYIFGGSSNSSISGEKSEN